MKKLLTLTVGLWLLLWTTHLASGASLYVFGDSLSASSDTINPAPGTASYYGMRWSNGRVWVEVLAQRQGLVLQSSNNSSYYDHNSSDVVNDLKTFKTPSDVANDLFIVWVCNADTFDAAQANYDSKQWPTNNDQAIANHLQIITNLYNRGVRTLIMPNAVDISKIPAFNTGTAYTNAEHAGCLDFNIKFANAINTVRTSSNFSGLTIYTPDFYTLLNDVLTNAAYYGLTNALSSRKLSIAATDDFSLPQPVVPNGPGTNYIFWDEQDPTAMFHEIIADIAQQIISPVQISALKQVNGSNRLDVVNMPVGLNGFLDGSTNPVPGSWTLVTGFNSVSTTQSLFVVTPPLPAGFGSGWSGGSGGGGSIDPTNPGTNTVANTNAFSAAQFYRLRFPYAWNWP